MAKMTIIEGNSNDKDNVRAYMVKGERGYSAYEIAVQQGYTGTEEEWKDSFINADIYYNKTETDDLLDNYYNKSETDNLLDAKANSSDVYTKTETDNLLKDTYSTSEVKTNKVWVDGKPIYRKTTYISALPNNTSEAYDAAITNVDRVISMDGLFQGTGSSTGNQNCTRPLNFSVNAAASHNIYSFYNITTGMIKITTTSDWSFMDGYVTLEYTKTTDITPSA